MPLLFDLEPLTCCQTDHVLDGLYKAIGEQPDADIWQPHHDPWQRDHVEAVTRHGLDRLNAIRDALTYALQEASGEPLHKADSPWIRWGKDEFDPSGLGTKLPVDFGLELVAWAFPSSDFVPQGVDRQPAAIQTLAGEYR